MGLRWWAVACCFTVLSSACKANGEDRADPATRPTATAGQGTPPVRWSSHVREVSSGRHRNNASKDALHRAALTDLRAQPLAGATRRRAIRSLQQVRADSPRDPRILLDLSAALVLDGAARNRAIAFLHAMELARQVRELTSDNVLLEAARANEALAVQRLLSPATRALGPPLDAGKLIDSLIDSLLPRLASDPAAPAVWTMPEHAARRLTTVGDESWLRLLEDLRAVQPTERPRMLQAWTHLAAARASYGTWNYAAAASSYAVARSAADGQPLPLLIGLLGGIATAQRSAKPEEASRLLVEARVVDRLAGSPVLRARLAWLSYTQALRERSTSLTAEDADSVVRQLRAAGDGELWAHGAVTQADVQVGNGEVSSAIERITSVLRDPLAHGHALPRSRAVGVLIEAAGFLGLSRAAESLLEQDTVMAGGDPLFVQRHEQIGYFVRRALDRGDTLAADRWLPVMENMVARIRHPVRGESARDFHAVLHWGRQRRRDPAGAAKAIDAALARMERSSVRVFRASAYGDAARAHLALGDTVIARRLLERAVAQRLQEVRYGTRRAARDAALRLRQPDIDLHATILGIGAPRRALAWRRAALGDRRQRRHPHLAMTLQSDTLVAWFDDPRGAAWMRRVPLSESALRSVVDRLASRLQRQEPARSLLGELRHLLLHGLPPVLDGAYPAIDVELDGPLQRIPLGALPTADGRSSIAVRTVVRVVLHGGQGRETSSSSSRQGVVIVADPELPLEILDQYPGLPGARDEAEQLRRIHRNARVLRGRDASASVLWGALPAASVLHVAAHAIPPDDDGHEGAILLAGDAGAPDGRLSERAIAAMPTGAPAIVILAACESAVRDDRAVGAEGIAGAWLDAGADAVIASLWPVDDTATQDIMIRLHRELATGRSAGEALSRAQTEAERDYGPTAAWRWAPWRVLVR